MDENKLQDDKYRAIALLATGSELLNGDLQDTNMHHFSKSISKHGGEVRFKSIVSDEIEDIIASMTHLLAKSQALITTGGLGPTSDDNTRFALAKAIATELEFDEQSWQHICTRLSRYGITITDNNKRQAFFPKNAIVLPNGNGSANGCYFSWDGKDIFMLPGPPSECWPLFETHVLPILEEKGYFIKKRVCERYLTMGFSESEISAKVDCLAKSYPIETAYRWHYPYLEIKLYRDEGYIDEAFDTAINKLLSGHIVSKRGEEAIFQLENLLKATSEFIYIHTAKAHRKYFQSLLNANCLFIDSNVNISNEGITLHIEIDCSPDNTSLKKATSTISLKVSRGDKCQFKAQIKTANRGKDIVKFYEAYVAWQLCQYINQFMLGAVDD